MSTLDQHSGILMNNKMNDSMIDHNDEISGYEIFNSEDLRKSLSKCKICGLERNVTSCSGGVSLMSIDEMRSQSPGIETPVCNDLCSLLLEYDKIYHALKDNIPKSKLHNITIIKRTC